MHPFFRNLRHRAILILTVLSVCAIASLIFSGMTGSVAIPLADLPSALLHLMQGKTDTLAATLLDLRLGRALSGFVTGAMLSLAGVMMQALLRNPLADPYVLGVSGGAAVGALAAMLLCSVAWMIDLAAFAGAITVALLLFGLAYRDLRSGISSN